MTSRLSWAWTSSGHSVGGPRAGDTGGGSTGSPTCARILRMGAGSMMNEMSRMSPPQAGHTSGNAAASRCRPRQGTAPLVPARSSWPRWASRHSRSPAPSRVAAADDSARTPRDTCGGVFAAVAPDPNARCGLPISHGGRPAYIALKCLASTDSGGMIFACWPLHLPCLVVTDIVEEGEVVRHGSEH